jgi:hypothetical protein
MVPAAIGYASFVLTNTPTRLVDTRIAVSGSTFTCAAALPHQMLVVEMRGATTVTATSAGAPSLITIRTVKFVSGTLRHAALRLTDAAGSIGDARITMECIAFDTTVLSFAHFEGPVRSTAVRTDSVALWMSQDIVGLLWFADAGTAGVTARIIHTYVHVQVIIHSASGAAGVVGISEECSHMSQYPMVEGFFQPALVPVVSRIPIWTCSKDYQPQCWYTGTRTMSLSMSETLTETMSQTAERTSTGTAEQSLTESEMQTGTASVTVSEEPTETASATRTVAPTPTPTATVVPTLTGSQRVTPTGVSRSASGSGTLTEEASVSASGTASGTWKRVCVRVVDGDGRARERDGVGQRVGDGADGVGERRALSDDGDAVSATGTLTLSASASGSGTRGDASSTANSGR